MRIASLSPSATEILFALGLGDDVVAVTHDCDHPPEAEHLLRLTRGANGAPRELDAELLAEEEPDLIVTQEGCDACATPYEELAAIAERIPSQPAVLALEAATLGEALGEVRAVATAAGAELAGDVLRDRIADRIDDVRIALGDAGAPEGAPRPIVAALDSLAPLRCAGDWVPQMIELAGGADLLGMPGEQGRELTWDELRATQPDVLLLMPRGCRAAAASEIAHAHAAELTACGARLVLAADAACFTRPGPRLVDGIEQLAHALHPARAGEPASGRLLALDLA